MLMLQKTSPSLLFFFFTNLLKGNLLVMTLKIFFMVMFEGQRALETGMPSMLFLPDPLLCVTAAGCNESREQKSLQACFLEYALSRWKEQLCCLQCP